VLELIDIRSNKAAKSAPMAKGSKGGPSCPQMDGIDRKMQPEPQCAGDAVMPRAAPDAEDLTSSFPTAGFAFCGHS